MFKGANSTDSLAHCISVDLRMGKGIALMFKKLFGGLSELQRQSEYSKDLSIYSTLN